MPSIAIRRAPIGGSYRSTGRTPRSRRPSTVADSRSARHLVDASRSGRELHTCASGISRTRSWPAWPARWSASASRSCPRSRRRPTGPVRGDGRGPAPERRRHRAPGLDPAGRRHGRARRRPVAGRSRRRASRSRRRRRAARGTRSPRSGWSRTTVLIPEPPRPRTRRPTPSTEPVWVGHGATVRVRLVRASARDVVVDRIRSPRRAGARRHRRRDERRDARDHLARRVARRREPAARELSRGAGHVVQREDRRRAPHRRQQQLRTRGLARRSSAACTATRPRRSSTATRTTTSSSTGTARSSRAGT